MSQSDLPPDAETFLARLSTLPEAAWDEILAHARLGPRRLLRVLWRAVRDIAALPFRRRRAATDRMAWSQPAIRRVFQLLKEGALPQRLGPRGLAMVHMAVQAVCLRATLAPQQVSRIYAPFEPFIPLASLARPEDVAPGSGGA